jgi:colicin import membrane protein
MKPVVAMILAASLAGCLTTDYGAENGKAVSQSEIGSLAAEVKRQIVRCWAPPAGIPPGTMLLVKVRFELNRDGTLARDPVALPVNSGDLQNAYFKPAAKSALRAVRACTPLQLPAARYEIWEYVEVVFDPKTVRAR